MEIQTLIEFLFALFCGLCCGSFVTLVSYRLPLGEDVVLKPSRCPKCETRLRFLDLWPVFSWAINRGRCRHCSEAVSFRYPLTEAICGLVFVLLYVKFGITPLAIVLALTWTALMVMIVVDFEHYLIPDGVHYALIALALGYHVLAGTPAETIIAGVITGGGIGLLLHHGYRLVRKTEGLGFGDVKFLAVAGLWLGAKPLVPFLFFSGLLGVATGLIWQGLKKGPVFPFGPSLALSMYLCLVIPQFPNAFWNIGQLVK